MSIFDELFNPSARFRQDEKNRLEWMRDEEGEGDPHRGPIDLDSGAVRIRVPGEAAGDADDATNGDADDDRVGGRDGSEPGGSSRS